MRIWFVLLLLFSGASQAAPSTLDVALRAQEAGDYAKAATLYLPLAAKGDAAAQFNLGILYSQGLIIQKDYRIALQWYLAAAEQGHAGAQSSLGELYASGKGVPQDFKKAMHWLTLSAKQGNSSAQLHIGEMYAQGQGVQQDDKEAVKWYRQAASLGNPAAHARLGECYEHGLGVAQDSAAASKWFNSAANHATDVGSRSAYLARQNEIDKDIASRQKAKEQQLAREEAERIKAAEAARAEAARIAAEQAAIKEAAEQARKKAEADAALEAQIQAYRQAAIEAKAAKLKEQQDAKAARDAEAAKRKAERHDKFISQEKRRRDEINAEIAQRRAAQKAQRTIKHNDPAAKPKKAAAIDDAHPLMHETSPQDATEKKRVPPDKMAEPAQQEVQAIPKPPAKIKKISRTNNAAESRPHQPGKKQSESQGKIRYPAKIELTDEELGNAAKQEKSPQSSNEAEKIELPIKIKHIEWSKKPDAP